MSGSRNPNRRYALNHKSDRAILTLPEAVRVVAPPHEQLERQPLHRLLIPRLRARLQVGEVLIPIDEAADQRHVWHLRDQQANASDDLTIVAAMNSGHE